MNHFLQQAVSLLAGLVLLVSSTVSSLPDKFHDFSSKFTYKPSVTSETQEKTAQTQKSGPSVLAATIDRSKTGVTFTIPAFFKDLLKLDSSLEVNGPSTFNDTVTLTNQDLNLGTGELTASNVLYGLTAGKGIIISQGQRPEVKLDIDVVSSISGRTGDVSLEEGSGISVDGLEISNTDKGSSQNIFKTFSVSGQDDIVASSNTSKLTFAAGTGIVLTTDASGKILTITSGLSTGWVDDGTSVRLTTSSDNVGIGTSSPGYKLDVAGNVNISEGSTYKIAGIDVLSSTSLGVGVTASSLTSLGTLGNVTVTGTSALNGGITFDNATDTISAFTAGGTINLANNIITNVGNAGTDFTASGGLTLAGLLTASSGISLDAETVTDFSGNGIAVTNNSLYVSLTTSSNTGSTSSNSGLEVGTAGLTLLKGCSDGELLKYTDAGGWACSVDIDTTAGSASGFTDFGSIVALITSADNLGIGTSSPTNKLSVVGTADISGNLGVGTTTPAFKLDVVGSANISSGSTYKINGYDVLSGTALGVGVTSSSITQLGTLGNLTVTGAIVGNGGLTLAAGQALNVNSDAITDLTGNGIVLSGGVLTVGLTSSGTTGSTSSNSGLEVGSAGLTLLKGCADNELLKYTDASGWACATDIDTTGANLAGFTDFGSIVALTTTADSVGIGTSSPTNKLSVVGTADISGNLGVGTTTPAFKLDVVGSANLSAGNTYKINGTDVLSGSALGVGVTASSLTSLGTLGNVTVAGVSALNGGITFDSSTDTISAFTAGGTINMATNIITDIGNSGTDFTGAGGLNLAGLLTASSGVSINSETVTDFSGNGIVVSSNSLAVNLTSSGTTGSTSSNSGLEVGSGGLTLLKGCTDGELLKYTDAGGWACAADADTGNTSGFTDFGSIVALTTTADNLGVGTSSPTNKLSVVGTADISGNLGVGTTTPAFKLDVAGSANLSSGSTYKINGTDVLSGSGLGVGVTASSLTSLGTLGNVTVTGTSALNGGITFDNSTDTISAFTAGGTINMADNLITDIGNSGTDFVAGGGLTLAGAFTANSTSVLNGAITLGDNAADTVTTNAGVWSFANATTVNLADNARGALNIEAGLLNLDTINTRVGIGTTTPTTTLDVVGTGKFSGLLTASSGLSINSETVTDFSGDGIVVTGNALTVNLTTSGTTGSTSSNSGLEVGSAGLTLLKGCTDGELLKYTDAGGWACAADSNTGNISGFTDFGSIVALTTTADSVGIGTSSPANKLSVVGTADVSGNFGIGTTNPAYKLDVVGSANLSSGSTYKINGADVLSASGLGIGVTASSLTSLGTLGNVTVSGISALNGGITFDQSSDTISSFTLSGTQYAGNNLIVNIGDNGTDFVAGGGLTLAGAFTANSTSALNGAVTLGDASSDTVTSNAGVWSYANSTTIDLVNSAQNALTIEGGLLSLDTLNSRVGIGSSSSLAGLDVQTTAWLRGAAAGASGLYVNGSGNVGIGITMPQNKLDVSGSVAFGSLPTNPLPQANSAYFSGNVGIGTTNPQANLNVANNSLSTGTGLLVSSTSTSFSSGKLASIDWSPTSATTATGDVLSVNVGANGTVGNIFNVMDGGSSVFSVSQSVITAGLPVNFTAPGDVGIAYDLLFSNQTASNIKSYGPLTIESGESFESNYLTLKTYNSGQIVFDAPGGILLAQAQPWTLATSAQALNIQNGLLNLDTTNSRVGIGTSNPLAGFDVHNTAWLRGAAGGTSGLYVNGSGNVGIGTTAPKNKLDVSGSVAFGSLPTNPLPQSNSAYFSGNVGIGTTNPTTTLDVVGTGKFSGLLTASSGLSINSETVTDFSGSGISVTGNALTVALTSSGTTGSTSSSSGLEVGSGGLTLLKGCADGELLKYTDAGGWACATDTDTNTGNISGFTDFGSTVALTTSADNLGVGTSSPMNKLSVTGNADISGNLGVGITIPAHKLDVVGNVNISAGSTYKVAGTDVISASGLGVGVTASSLTSLGTLGNLTVTGTSALNGGITFDNSTDTISAFTLGGTQDAATNLIVNIGDNGTDFIAGGGLTLAGAFTANSTSALNGAVTLGDASSDTVTSNAGVWSYVNSTTIDLVNSARNALTIEGGLLSLDTLNSRIGIGSSSSLAGLDVQTTAWLRGAAAGASGLYVNGSGNVGIGITMPQNKLDVSGSVAFGSLPTNPLPQANSAYFSGNVGIGTTNPGFALEVNGTARINGGITFGDASADTVTSTAGSWTFSNASTFDLANSQLNSLNFESGLLNIDTSGSTVGIGTTVPTAKLSVLQTGSANSFLVQDAASDTSPFVIDASGRVGIGTTTPSDSISLEVVGDTRLGGNISRNAHGSNNLNDQGSISPNGGFEGLTVSTANLPDDWADVDTGSAVSTTQVAQGDRSLRMSTANDEVMSTCYPATGGNILNFNMSSYLTSSDTTRLRMREYTTLANCTSNTSPTTTDTTACTGAGVGQAWTTCSAAQVLSSGTRWMRTGIYFHTKSSTHVYVDSVRVTQNALTYGLDLAETYPAAKADGIKVGEIVSFGTATKQVGADVNNVTRSSRAYDNLAFGIVSTKPGIVLDEDNGTEKIQVALKGRVPVLVSTENGPIKVGDPIVASSKPGVGMKATKAGKILGYAMTEYENTDPTVIDQVIVFVESSWFDPSLALGSTGDVNGVTSSFASLSPNNTDNVAKDLVKISSDFEKLTLSMNALDSKVDGVDGEVKKLSSENASLTTRLSSLEDKLKQLEEGGAVLGIGSTNPQLSGESIASASATLEDADSLIDGTESKLSELTVTGLAKLNNLNVIGDATFGMMQIVGIDPAGGSNIDTITGPLRLQATALNDLDIMNGKVLVTTDGNIITKGQITAKKLNISTQDDADDNSVGVGKLLKGTKKVVVKTTAITAKSHVFVTPKTLLDYPLVVTVLEPQTSFTVEVKSSEDKDVEFDWFIVN